MCKNFPTTEEQADLEQSAFLLSEELRNKEDTLSEVLDSINIIGIHNMHKMIAIKKMKQTKE